MRHRVPSHFNWSLHIVTTYLESVTNRKLQHIMYERDAAVSDTLSGSALPRSSDMINVEVFNHWAFNP